MIRLQLSISKKKQQLQECITSLSSITHDKQGTMTESVIHAYNGSFNGSQGGSSENHLEDTAESKLLDSAAIRRLLIMQYQGEDPIAFLQSSAKQEQEKLQLQADALTLQIAEKKQVIKLFIATSDRRNKDREMKATLVRMRALNVSVLNLMLYCFTCSCNSLIFDGFTCRLHNML